MHNIKSLTAASFVLNNLNAQFIFHVKWWIQETKATNVVSGIC